MHRQRVGQIQRVQLLLLVRDHPVVVKQHGHHMLRWVDALDIAHVAVEHALPFFGAEGRLTGILDLIIVFGLNDLVAHSVLRLAVQQGIHAGTLGFNVSCRSRFRLAAPQSPFLVGART